MILWEYLIMVSKFYQKKKYFIKLRSIVIAQPYIARTKPDSTRSFANSIVTLH